MNNMRSVPQYAGDIQRWSIGVVNYLKALEIATADVTPRSVQLENRQSTLAKATTNGVIMWDETAGTIVVSKDGAWYPVSLGAVLP